MYIKKLELLNFQVIERFEAEFDGNVYFITGDNELGKSTLLKAIGALLTGERDEVLRNGASKGFAKMIVGDDGEEFDVSLSFTENNPRGTLTIKQKSTGMATNNVSMLQRIFGYQDFDAVEFSRWSETAEGRRKQIAVVKALLPAEIRERIEAIEGRVSELKAERTGVNRDVKTFDALLAQIRGRIDFDMNAYSTPVDITALMEKQHQNAALIERAKTIRVTLAQRTEQLAAIPARIESENARFAAELADIDKSVADAKAAYEKALEKSVVARTEAEDFHTQELGFINGEKKDIETRKKNCEDWLAKYEAANPEKENVAEMLEKAEAHNKRFSLVEQFKEKRAQYEDFLASATKIEDELKALSAEKDSLITGANLPIEGLTFTDDGLELNGIPFVPGRVSDSQQMEVAAKLVIASNPTVRVFRIARGESLGAKRLQAIIEIAKKNGFQGFIEQVQRGQAEMLVEEYTEQN